MSGGNSKQTLFNVLLLAVIAVCADLAESQPIATTILANAVTDAVIVPETLPVGVSAAAAVAAVRPEVEATTVAVKRHSRLQAAAALRRAKPWRPVLNSTTGSGDFGSQAICGANNLVADNSATNCRIVTTFPNGGAFSCSSFKMGDRLLGTAGHCLYSKPNGGWASSIDVYCTGSVACGGQRTTYATQITTTPSWVASSTDIPTAWDGAAIKTAEALPGTAFTLAMYGSTGAKQVTLTGYPAQGSGPGCESSAYAGACYQYSSTDIMDVTPQGMYSSSSLDLCSGHSGSGVMTADAGRYLVAVVTGASFSPCANYFVPQINSNAGVNGNCEKPSGGVSFACLAAKFK